MDGCCSSMASEPGEGQSLGVGGAGMRLLVNFGQRGCANDPSPSKAVAYW